MKGFYSELNYIIHTYSHIMKHIHMKCSKHLQSSAIHLHQLCTEVNRGSKALLLGKLVAIKRVGRV